MHQPKYYEYKNEDEVNSPNILSDEKSFVYILSIFMSMVLFFRLEGHDVGHLLCGCIWGWHSVNSFVCFGTKPHKGPVREISQETRRTREGRSQRWVDRRVKRRTVNRREQQRPIGMRVQSREGDSQQKGEQRRQSTDMKAGQRRKKNRSQKDDC